MNLEGVIAKRADALYSSRRTETWLKLKCKQRQEFVVCGYTDRRGYAIGEHVAVSPSQPCGVCLYCQQGLQNHCLDLRYYGSAMRTPHVQGAFRKEIVIELGQAHRLATGISDGEGSMAEPLAVALHAVNRAGPMLGKRVLVTGCGPIGALVVIATRRAGAANIVVTDMTAQPLRSAMKVGADLCAIEQVPRPGREILPRPGPCQVHRKIFGSTVSPRMNAR